MMKFSRPNGGIVSIALAVTERLLSFRQLKNSSRESGGIILGRLLVDNDDVIVDEITSPGPKDFRSRFSFLRRRDSAQKRVNAAWIESKGMLVYLGEWHTHPEDVPTPSYSIDLKEWRRIAKEASFEQDFLLFLIVGRTQTNAWELEKATGKVTELQSVKQHTLH